jgi:hypothetical protein
LLRAIAAGYDVGSRAALAAGPPSARARPYAVTAAAATLLPLSADQLRRVRNMQLFAANLAGTGALREDLSIEEVADVIWATNSAEF